MFRDKMYVRTKNGLLFNVTGYRHPTTHVFASLKYVGDEKWKHGYAAAKQYLQHHHPEFVDEFIVVPHDQIDEVFDPQRRWLQLRRDSRSKSLEPLLSEAVELGTLIRDELQIPLSSVADRDSEFGITDSLLWGGGHAESDIDLVVVGRDNARRLQLHMPNILERDGFERPDPTVMTAPYGLSVDIWPWLLTRKAHMGSFRGRLFSIRGMLSTAEVRVLPAERNVDQGPVQRVEFEVDDVSDSIFFPSIYRNGAGDELVDYSVVYEGAFREGDVVRCDAVRETVRRYLPAAESQQVTRYVIDGRVECETQRKP